MKRLSRILLAFLLVSALVAPLVGCSESTAPPTYSAPSQQTAPQSAAPQSAPSQQSNGLDPNYYSSPPPGANPSPDSKGVNTQWHEVSGYTKSNGTYVAPHYRRTKP